MYLYKIHKIKIFKVQNLVNHKFWYLIKKVYICDSFSRKSLCYNKQQYDNIKYAEQYIIKREIK